MMAKDNTKVSGSENFCEKKIKVGNVAVNYAETKTRITEGPTIVCIHGWTNNWMGFIPLGVELMKKHRVILMDLPGYGDSDRLPKYSVKILAEYVNKFIDELKLKNFYILGHSMGTFIVSDFLKNHPKKATGAILVGAVVKNGNKERGMKVTEKFYNFLDKRDRLKTVAKKVVDKNWYAYLTSKYVNMYKFDKELIKNYGTVGRKKASKEAYVQMGADIARQKIEEMIVGNQRPILFIFGKHDKLCSCGQAKMALKDLGDYGFVEIEEAGHIVTVEKPREVAELIEGFIG
ncbi:MAG: alpha/beta hydrolase [Candidatus Shapirobacteria bacterium]